MIKSNKSSVNLVLTALFAAIIVVLTMTSIPMPTGVPVTLQTFGIALCGYLLGMKLGVTAVGLYMALGAVGLPVFSGFQGGFGPILGYTGGFMWGFFLMALLCGLAVKKENKVLRISLGLVGLLLCHLLGVVQYSIVSGTPFLPSALAVSVPYLIKDVVSVLAALAVAVALQAALKKSGLVKA